MKGSLFWMLAPVVPAVAGLVNVIDPKPATDATTELRRRVDLLESELQKLSQRSAAPAPTVQFVTLGLSGNPGKDVVDEMVQAQMASLRRSQEWRVTHSPRLASSHRWRHQHFYAGTSHLTRYSPLYKYMTTMEGSR